jgi:hypothetical protein
MNDFRFGFRVVGNCENERRLVDAAAAFHGHAECDARAEVASECYLSAFQFADDFAEYLETTGSTKGFDGPCWAPWLWFDVDREHDIDRAATDARRLAAFLVERFALDGDGLLLFHSGSKGFHVGLPTALWLPEPSKPFNKVARRFAVTMAELAGVSVFDPRRGSRIDESVYDKQRLFRAPNSRHPKTGRHKRRFSFDELLGLSVGAMLKLAETPAPFDIPPPPARNTQAVADWQAAVEQVAREAEAMAQRRAANGSAKLNRGTLELIRNVEPIAAGDRHRLLFSAAANLAECGCPSELAHQLLTETGRDCGLPPSEVKRQIDCGLQHVYRLPVANGSPAEIETINHPTEATTPPPGQLFSDDTGGAYYDARL